MTREKRSIEHTFDADDLSCGSGLPAEARRRMGTIDVGDRLAIITRDAAAREDLPALMRLLGHRVITVDHTGDSTTITVERTR